MQTLVVASRKGGSGKTTLTAHLAVAAGLNRKGPAALMDLDPQGSLAHWWNERGQEEPFYLRSTIDRLPEDHARLADAGLNLLFIDTPPVYSKTLDKVIALADLVLIPCRPSPHDLRAVGATVSQVESLGKPYVFVLNGAPWRARMTAESAAILKEFGPLSPAFIYNRVDLASGMVGGLTVLETKSRCKASQEVRTLWQDIAVRLESLRLAKAAAIDAPIQAPLVNPLYPSEQVAV